jgi:hypothetical protein
MRLRSLVRIARVGVRQCRRVFPRGAVNPIRPYGADDVFGISPLTPSQMRMLRIWCAQSHNKFRSVRSVPSVRWRQVCAYLYTPSYRCNRLWRPIRLWDVEASTFSTQSVHRWRWSCQPYAPAALYSQEDSWYSFLLEAESTPGPRYGWKD